MRLLGHLPLSGEERRRLLLPQLEALGLDVNAFAR